MKGYLFINYDPTATPIADEKIKEKILSEWALVKEGTQTKQFNVSNILVFAAVQHAAFKGELDGERIIFMIEQNKCQMRYKQFGSSIRPLPSCKELREKDLLNSTWMKDIMGF